MQPQTTSPADFQTYLDAHVIVAPAGVELRRGPHGLGLFVTRPFHQGEEVLRAIEFHIPDDDHIYRARVQVGGAIEEIDVTPMQSVRYEGFRAIDLPGCLMNHSCDPSTLSIDVKDDAGEKTVGYIQVATRDLVPGDEITCDYVLFDWDGDGHRFECQCGSPGCYGYVAGFVSLPPETQEKLADRIYSEIRRKWERTRG
jgi:hypothetical protein